jgi:hypothetical protein
VEQYGTRIGDVSPLPALTIPFISTPSQNPMSNYWPIWLTGGVHIQPFPAHSGIIMENFHNDIGVNGSTGYGPFDDPIIRGAWATTAWLGNDDFRFWQVHTYELWLAGTQITSSDMRFKKNIESENNALPKLMMLRPVNYDMVPAEDDKSPENKKEIMIEKGKNKHGLIAQEVQQVYPELVHQNANGYLGVDYQSLIPLLLKAIQEQQAQIDSLKVLIKK